MFKGIISYFWSSRGDEAPLTLEEAYDIVNDSEEEVSNIENEPPEEIANYEIENKTGKITEIVDGKCKIDHCYEFETDQLEIHVGTKISYRLMKNLGEVKVVDVQILENDWNVIETGKKNWHERTLVGSVIKREGRVLTINPGLLTINLNEISSEFIPIEGDWVELDVRCEVDENVVDLSGKIIEINKVLPLRAQIKVGQVTKWNSHDGTGVIDKNVFFNKDSLYCGYLPVQNDKVIVEIIESNQGYCTWRALKIIPDYLHYKDKSDKIHSVKEEDCLDSHDLVNITDNISLNFTQLGEAKLFTVEIETIEQMQLVCIEIPKVNGQCKLSTSVDHYTIKPNQPLSIRFECKARGIGDSRELIIFHFDKFKLGRWVNIYVNHRDNNSQNKVFKNKENTVIPRTHRETIRGQRFHTPVRFLPLRMPDFAVPQRLTDLVSKYRKQANLLRSELERMKPCLVSTLTYMNYEDRFHTLLYLDEIHTMLEMQNYDQERACFIKSGEYLLLEIENLAERRPSVIQGDRVIARNINDSKSPDYEGFIHKTGKNHAYIKFSQIFHDSYDGEDYAVFIIASRVTYRRKHFAINLAIKNLGKEWLFPTKTLEKEPQLDFSFDSYTDTFNTSNDLDETTPHNSSGKERLLEKIRKFHEGLETEIPIQKLEWHNQSLNYYQKEAVRNIILGVCRPLPYIIFGPPGTGKTVTIVETVLQILRLMPHSRILLSAPSNSAADLLALRLIDSGVLKPGDLIRLVAMTAVSSIPAKLAPYCATANIEREGTETHLPVVTSNGLVLGYSSSVLGRHRITVCTCSSAGLLFSMGFSKGHFTHVIVDEAGQTSEPSVLIPLAFLDVTSGQAVLAGDPMQLGPVVLSSFASEYGLDESFLERLISRFPYMRDTQGFSKTCGYDPRLITKLIYNYRSLPDLLKLPSVLFYNDDLLPTISDEDSKEADLLKQVGEILPHTKEGKLGCIMFHSVVGENFQTEDSPSWFNPSEASQVFYYVNELYRLGLKNADIGIITPYKAQTKQLIELFKEAEFDFPKVGTVEEFQGQEFNVIIVSTVRSNKKYVAADIKFTMGFIASPRRLNVSITRAKALMIIVGNGELLVTDRSWRSVINYCIDMGTYVGTPIKSK